MTDQQSVISANDLCRPDNQAIRGKEIVLSQSSDLRGSINVNPLQASGVSAMSFGEFLESQRLVDGPDSITAWAVSSMLPLLPRDAATGNYADSFSDDTLRWWLVMRILRDSSAATVRRYYGRLHALWQQWAVAGEDDVFAEAKYLLSGSYSHPGHGRKVLPVLRRIAVRSMTDDSPRAELCRILLWLIYRGGDRISAAIDATLEPYDGLITQIEEITERQRKPRRKYLFLLQQGKKTQRSILIDLTASLRELLRSCGLLGDQPLTDGVIADLWCAAALEAGLPPAEVRDGMACAPAPGSLFSLVDASPNASRRRDDIRADVADAIAATGPEWFVMNLRRRVTPDDIRATLQQRDPHLLAGLDFFYPCEEIVKIRGRRRQTLTVPVIPSILFFRTRRDTIPAIFRLIGEQAWCYRTTDRPEADYAAIPAHEMRNFQLCIGHFSPDANLHLETRNQSLRAGREVEIIGGEFAGYRGRIEDVRTPQGDPTDLRILSISLNADSQLRWTVTIPEPLIRPL